MTEAWSLAYLLAREGHKGSVIGIDISKSSIATAAGGTYRRLEHMGSLREVPDFAIADFPARAGECWNARPDLRAVTRFMTLSLLEAPPVPQADIVLCRNVMIYFSLTIVEELIQRIAAIMPEGGILALGGAGFDGLADIGDRVVPVKDLRRAFTSPRDDQPPCVLLQLEGALAGIAVDQVLRIEDVAESDVEPVSDAPQLPVHEVAHVRGRLMAVLTLDRLLTPMSDASPSGGLARP